jgi:hypothetical protein
MWIPLNDRDVGVLYMPAAQDSLVDIHRIMCILEILENNESGFDWGSCRSAKTPLGDTLSVRRSLR